jgi:hypothetical protein
MNTLALQTEAVFCQVAFHDKCKMQKRRKNVPCAC